VSETDGLVEVHVLGLPMDVFQQTSEHTDELLREFALIREWEAEDNGGRHVPRRLLELVDRLGREFSGFTGQQEAQLKSAAQEGVASVDLVYRVPPAVRQACIELGAMLDEADEFCRQGRELLTLASRPRDVAFRNWFLGEFVRQIDGQSPMTWDDASK
jgi:hypothetical protein